MKRITMKNYEMANMIRTLEPLLKHRDMIGYIAARNFRILSDSLTEFNKFRESLILKYGEADIDEDGNELSTISVNPDSENFQLFCNELEPFANIEHEVEIMTASYTNVIGTLSGEEILDIEWMLEE